VGAPPTHIDAHQHVHKHEPVDSVVRELGRHLAVPVRDRSGVRYLGSFYGQTATGAPVPEWISVEALLALLDGLPDGWTELGCHPGYAEDTEDAYRLERRIEVRTLCDPAVRARLERNNIELRSFAGAPTGSPNTDIDATSEVLP
jgi:predicted glycoside hydrolase/deacetylase ChbG (UPF0249 family)